MTPRKDWDRTVWKVVLRTPAGIPVRESIGFAGDRLSFKKVAPGNYVVCVLGDRGRRGCRSVDLTLPAGSRRLCFDMELDAPRAVLHQSDLHRANRYELAVPPRAREEMFKAGESSARGDSAASLEHMEKALQIYPEYVDALVGIGRYQHGRQEYGLAIEKFTRATELDPQCYAAWMNLGGSFASLGRYDQALVAHSRAYSLRSSDTRVLSALALDNFHVQNYEDAKGYFQKLIEADPAHAVGPQIYLARIAMLEKRLPEAGDYLRGYLTLHPNSPKAPELKQWLERLSGLSDVEFSILAMGK